MSRPLAARKQIHLTLLQSGEPRPVLVDRVKMTKVFNNLIGNAIKYCQRGARIEVCVWRVDDRVMVAVDDDFWVLVSSPRISRPNLLHSRETARVHFPMNTALAWALLLQNT